MVEGLVDLLAELLVLVRLGLLGTGMLLIILKTVSQEILVISFREYMLQENYNALDMTNKVPSY
jgi:hypothetical protein